MVCRPVVDELEGIWPAWVFRGHGALTAGSIRPHAGTTPQARALMMATVEIHAFEGDRTILRPLFRMADDSEQEIDGYLLDGEILAAVVDGALVGHLQLVTGPPDGVVELKSMAVLDARRGEGVGRALVEEAVRRSQCRGAHRLIVATAAADTGNLRFYQRLNFRMVRIERDAFGPDAGYADGTLIDGIPLRDRVWLERELD